MSRSYDFLVFLEDIRLFSLIFPSGLQQELSDRNWNVTNFYMIFTFWTINGSWKGPIKYSLPVLQSVLCHPFVYLGFWIVSLVFFSRFWHGARNLYEVACGRAGFFWKISFPQILRKLTKTWPNFFEFIKKIGLNLFYK